MLKFLVLLACVYASLGFPVGPESDKVVPIVSEESEAQPDGSFRFSYETGNGIKVQEEGVPKPAEKGEIAESISGSYEFTPPEGGKSLKISFVADETGYHPEGDAIPVAPPIPEPIQRALRYLAEHPQPQELGEKIH